MADSRVARTSRDPVEVDNNKTVCAGTWVRLVWTRVLCRAYSIALWVRIHTVQATAARGRASVTRQSKP